MIESIFSETGLTLLQALAATGVSMGLGLIIAFVYTKLGSYTKNFAITLAVLPILIQAVIILVNGNLGMGIATLAVFGLVRFRSVPGTSREILSVFFTVAIGLATGTGLIYLAMVLTVIVLIVMIVLSKTKILEVKTKILNKELRVTIPESLDYTVVFDDLFEKYVKSCSLTRVRSTNLGSLFELRYSIILADEKKEKQFLDELRTRNGNLPVSIGIETFFEQGL